MYWRGQVQANWACVLTEFHIIWDSLVICDVELRRLYNYESYLDIDFVSVSILMFLSVQLYVPVARIIHDTLRDRP